MCQPFEKYPILIVEDDKAHVDSLYELISEQMIYKISIANTVDEALSFFCKEKYVIVFVDLNLNGSITDGINLITKLRSQDPDVFIIVITAHSEYIFNKKIVDSVDDFIRKPLDIDFFSSKLFLWSTKYNRRKELKETFLQKCNAFEDRITGYESRISGLDDLDSKIEDVMRRMSSGGLIGEEYGL